MKKSDIEGYTAMLKNSYEEADGATSFSDKNTAIKATKDVLNQNLDKIDDWLVNGTSNRLTLTTEHDFSVGYGVLKDSGEYVDNISKTVTVIQKTSDNELGFKINNLLSQIKLKEELIVEQDNKIIYFFDSYYLMLDYDQTLNQIVNEFVENETEETTNEIISQMEKVLSNLGFQEKTLSEIITNCIEMNTTPRQMLEMIKELFDEFKSVKKV